MCPTPFVVPNAHISVLSFSSPIDPTQQEAIKINKMRAPLALVLAVAAAAASTATCFVLPAGRARAPFSAAARTTATAAVTMASGEAQQSSRRGLLEDAGKMGLLTLGLVGGVRYVAVCDTRP